MTCTRLLIIDETRESEEQISALLSQEKYQVEFLAEIEAALERSGRTPYPDVLLFNFQRIDRGMQCIAALRRAHSLLKIIALLPGTDAELVVRAVRMGADACAWKTDDGKTVLRAIDRCLPATHTDIVPETELPGDVEDLGEGKFFVTASPAMRNLRTQVGRIAVTDLPLLILGESGTGKEVIARLIHGQSPRSDRRFLKVNCAALPGELLESELFGYERGAFTGAVRSTAGKFEACNGGTLFLDEIAEMPPALQAKLLHVLQDQEFSRLGSCARVKVNVRIVAATNVDIKAAIAAKTFREDLYYRLSGFV